MRLFGCGGRWRRLLPLAAARTAQEETTSRSATASSCSSADNLVDHISCQTQIRKLGPISRGITAGHAVVEHFGHHGHAQAVRSRSATHEGTSICHADAASAAVDAAGGRCDGRPRGRRRGVSQRDGTAAVIMLRAQGQRKRRFASHHRRRRRVAHPRAVDAASQ